MQEGETEQALAVLKKHYDDAVVTLSQQTAHRDGSPLDGLEESVMTELLKQAPTAATRTSAAMRCWTSVGCGWTSPTFRARRRSTAWT